MFAVLEIPAFPLHALLRFQPALRGEAVALVTGEGRRATVAHVPEHIRGVRPGMTAAQALAECPGVQLVSASPLAEKEATALLLAAAWMLSPRVEPTEGGRCIIDLDGANSSTLPRLVAEARARLASYDLPSRIGLAANPVIAGYAAHLAEPEKWIEDAFSFLAPLPIGLLPLHPDEAQLFSDLGLRTLGSLTAFPRAALNDRLGQRGDALWALAKGEYSGTLRPASYPTRFRAELELEEAVETLEPLLFTLRRFVDRLAAEVGDLGNGATRMSLRLRLDSDQDHTRDFDLPEPTASADALFAVLEHHLSALTTDAPIVGVVLEVFPARRLEQQTGLFDTGLVDAGAFFASLASLRAIVGTENVGRPTRADSHCPDLIRLDTPATMVPARTPPPAPPPHGPLLRRLRPAVAATVELDGPRPAHVVSAVVSGDVRVLRRPFWANGEWGAPHEWKREEWDVRIGPGLYRLLHEPRGWFIDGIYD